MAGEKQSGGMQAGGKGQGRACQQSSDCNSVGPFNELPREGPSYKRCQMKPNHQRNAAHAQGGEGTDEAGHCRNKADICSRPHQTGYGPRWWTRMGLGGRLRGSSQTLNPETLAPPCLPLFHTACLT